MSKRRKVEFLPFEIRKGKEIIDRFETREQAEEDFDTLKKRGCAYKGLTLKKIR